MSVENQTKTYESKKTRVYAQTLRQKNGVQEYYLWPLTHLMEW